MKLKLYRITQEGVKELVLTETAPFICFEINMLAARFYPERYCSVTDCNKMMTIPVGYFAEIVE